MFDGTYMTQTEKNNSPQKMIPTFVNERDLVFRAAIKCPII